ncbi:hypothetical protein Tco_1115512, partial [Tanacetum coccineum]
FVPQAVLLRTGKVNIPSARPQPVPTGKPKVPAPVPTGRPTSSYFQTYTPYVPQMYYNHMKYGGVRWATAVKPSAGCSWKTHRKGLYWQRTSEAEYVAAANCCGQVLWIQN